MAPFIWGKIYTKDSSAFLQIIVKTSDIALPPRVVERVSARTLHFVLCYRCLPFLMVCFVPPFLLELRQRVSRNVRDQENPTTWGSPLISLKYPLQQMYHRACHPRVSRTKWTMTKPNHVPRHPDRLIKWGAISTPTRGTLGRNRLSFRRLQGRNLFLVQRDRNKLERQLVRY